MELAALTLSTYLHNFPPIWGDRIQPSAVHWTLFFLFRASSGTRCCTFCAVRPVIRYIILGIKWWVRGQWDANCRMLQSTGQARLQHLIALSSKHRGCVLECVSDEASPQHWMVKLCVVKRDVDLLLLATSCNRLIHICAASYCKHRVARVRVTCTHTIALQRAVEFGVYL